MNEISDEEVCAHLAVLAKEFRLYARRAMRQGRPGTAQGYIDDADIIDIEIRRIRTKAGGRSRIGALELNRFSARLRSASMTGLKSGGRKPSKVELDPKSGRFLWGRWGKKVGNRRDDDG